MENETAPTQESVHAENEEIPKTCHKRRAGSNCAGKAVFLFVVIVLSFISGMAGSVFERTLPAHLARVPLIGTWMHKPVVVNKKQTAALPQTLTDTGDEALVGIVDRSSSAVVSVVATKLVTQNQGGFDSLPFLLKQFGYDIGGDGTAGPSQGRDGQTAPEKQKVGSGTGFFVSSDGLVVTNKHVVADTTADYTVVLSGGKEYPAKVLAVSPNQDIAVLKIDGSDFPSLPLGDSGALRVGQTAIAIGNPLGEFPNSVSRGIISGLNRNVTAGSDFGQSETLSDIIQTDAAINPGNSGGPLLDLSGNVIGINVAVAQNAENIGFAIPINQVKRIIDDVKTTGKISTPYIGVRYAVIDDAMQKENDLPYNYGAIVVRGTKPTELAVVPGSPADKAGIVENDIILEIDGTKIDTDHPLGNIVADHRAGDTLSLKVWHKGAEETVSVTLAERRQ